MRFNDRLLELICFLFLLKVTAVNSKINQKPKIIVRFRNV